MLNIEKIINNENQNKCNLKLDASRARQTKNFLWDSTFVHRIKNYWSLTKQYEANNYKEVKLQRA